MKTLFFAGRNPLVARGTSWKFWKIQRRGRVVESRWGPMMVVHGRMVPLTDRLRKVWPKFATISATLFGRRLPKHCRIRIEPLGPDDIAYIRKFIRYCRRGSFRIH